MIRRRAMVAALTAALTLPTAAAAADPWQITLHDGTVPDTRPELDHRYRADLTFRSEIAEQVASRARADRRRYERTEQFAAEVDAARQREADRLAAEKAARIARRAAEAAARAAAEAAAKAQAEAAEEARRAAAWSLPVSGYRLTGRFGDRGRNWRSTHTGLDFAAPTGTKIRAIHGGVVTFVGWAKAYGNQVAITHDDGTVSTYSHMSGFAVTAGERVTTGQYIGRVGSTGNSTGSHVHLEVHVGGRAVDPQQYLTSKGVRP